MEKMVWALASPPNDPVQVYAGYGQSDKGHDPLKRAIDLISLAHVPLVQPVEQRNPASIGSAIQPIDVLFHFFALLLDVSQGHQHLLSAFR
jgi:hypothetical protein